MDSSSDNWLGFSLSNHHHHNLCFFEAFNSSSSNPGGSVANGGTESDARNGETDLSIFSDGPKLEDFLGCSTTATGTVAQPLQQQLQLGQQFCTDSEIYDSELKTMAASFLRGFSAEQNDTQQKPQQLINPTEIPPKKCVESFGQRTSIYRGVTKHRWTGRYEAHLWDNSCRREGQSRKGRQVYLGGYDKEDKAARAYDLAALKYWGPTTTTNFPVCNYEKELEEMKNMTRQEFVASLRRKSSGFSRGASIYRGVTRHHQHGRWQARIGRVAGNKDLYLGTFSTQEEAAEAYDIAAIKFRGLNAVTNFDMSRYDVKSIANSNLPIGGMSGKSKNSSESHSDIKSIELTRSSDDRDFSSGSSITFSSPATNNFNPDYFSLIGYQNPNPNPMYQSSSNGSVYQTLAPFNMEFSATSSGNESNNGEFNGGYVHQQLPYATPIAINGNSNNYGKWVSTFQSGKPNLSVFQTAIFGME